MKTLLFYITLVLASFIQAQEAGRGGDSENASPAATFNNVHAIVIGISNYEEIKQLNYADDDAELIAYLIEKNYPKSKGNIIKLTDKKASELNILTGLNQVMKKVQANDLVIFYFAGHGNTTNTKSSGKGYLLAYDASQSGEYDAGGAVKFDQIHDSIAKMLDKKATVYMITDACHSGASTNLYGSKLTQESIFSFGDNVTRFISCQRQEESLELDSLQHGAFTYYLAKGIAGEANTSNDAGISSQELKAFIVKNVPIVTKQRQNPDILAPDLAAQIFTNDKDILAFLNPESLRNDVAMRATNPLSPAQIKLNTAISNGDFYGKSTSANFIIDNATKMKSVTLAEIDEMKTMLADALINRAQDNINNFLKGEPQLGSTTEYSGTVKDLRMAAEILGARHFMTATLLNRANFFEAMNLIRKGTAVDFQAAENLLIALQKAEPTAAYVNQGLAMLFAAKNNKEAAQQQLKEVQGKISTWDKPKNTDAQLNILSGKLDLAMQQLTSSETISSDKSDVYLLRAQMHLANFELMDAQKEIDRIKNSSPGSYKVERALLLGKIEELRGRLDKAEESYKVLLNTKDVNGSLLLKLAELSKTKGDTLKAKEYYTQVLAIEPNNLSAKNGLIAINKGSISSSALNYYNYDDVMNHLATLEQQKKYTEALVVINKTLEINNWNPEYYYQKGKILYAQAKKTESIEALKKAIELSPYHFESIKALTYILIEIKKNSEAGALLQQHDKYFQRSAKWLSFQVNANILMNNKRELIPLLEKAIVLDSFDLEPRRGIIKLLLDDNFFAEAQKELDGLMANGGTEADEVQYKNLVFAQVKKEFYNGNYLPLVDGIELLLKESPEDPDFLYMGAMIHYMNLDYEKANQSLRTLGKMLQSLTPAAQGEYAKMKGKVLLEQKKFEEAEMAFQQYNKNGSIKCFFGIAMAQYELGKKDSWMINFQKGGDDSEFNAAAQERLQRMSKKAGIPVMKGERGN
ncbi:MAG: caspase family protein [Bacteroidota bacterium]